MTYDKVKGKIGFNEKEHTYTNIETGEKYISVTTLLSKFKPKFEGDYWATYKACKDAMEEAGEWYGFKKSAGGWENVVNYWHQQAINHPMQLQKDIKKRKKNYLTKWTKEGRIANEKGSKIHEDLEKAAHHSRLLREGDINYEVTEEDILAIQDFTTNKVYPELLIHNDEFMISGQCDQVFKEGKYVDIEDYKTYKKLSYEGFRDETMLQPIQHL